MRARNPLPIEWSPGLDRGFVVSGDPRGRLYLRPTGLIGGGAAVFAVEAGRAKPLAGGPLAFTALEVLRREGSRVVATLAAPAEIMGWARAAGPAIEDHVAGLVDVLSRPRPPYAGLSLDRPRVMGIVNVTPDSFSDGGDCLDSPSAIAAARTIQAAGADIVDIGGESTRPGSTPVPVAAELGRVEPVLAGLADLVRAGAVLSIDTRRAAVMRVALDAGAAILNDVTALAGDPDSLPLAARSGASVVLMHMQGEPATMQADPFYGCAPLDIYDWLDARVEACVAAGIPRARIAVDPGIGFGKRLEHNLAILERLALFHGLGCALLLGASRKRFLKLKRGEAAPPPKARLGGSLAAASHALGQGVQILRVHDTAETAEAAALFAALSAGPSSA